MERSLKPPKQSRFVSWFLSLLFCMLNGSSLFVCGMCFTVVIIFLTTDRDVDSFVVLVFISLLSNLIISFYILIRELLYKLIHCLGYRAQPDLRVLRMRRGFDIHFPVFEKYGQDYKLLYKRRSNFARYPAFLVYMVTIIVIIMGNRSWKKITERLKARENVTVLAAEHGYPIFAAKEEA